MTTKNIILNNRLLHHAITLTGQVLDENGEPITHSGDDVCINNSMVSRKQLFIDTWGIDYISYFKE